MPYALIALVAVPAATGSLRLVEVFGGPHVMPANPGISASPVPVVVHITCAVGYAVLGAFQFSAALRRRRPGWHRAAGRVLVVLGLAVALSALWMTVFYRPGTGVLAQVFRLVFGTAMAAGIVLGLLAIRRGDIAGHRAWMTRAYALALSAGTQVFTLGIGEAILGRTPLTIALGLGAGWVINLAVAEYVIRRAESGMAPDGYRIRVGGLLDDHWSGWFGGLTLTRHGDGTTSLAGAVADQAALHGLLGKVRDLGVTLISVEIIDRSCR